MFWAEPCRFAAVILPIVNGRVRSISTRTYRMLLKASPPADGIHRADGALFRRLAELWVFLDDRHTKSQIFRKYHKAKQPKKVDYRIFNGQVDTVEKGWSAS